MSKKSPEQRSYSVDEMMERLRDGEREKLSQPQGEMVTRPDGTQVMRVRKRKRRSKQPGAREAKNAQRQRKSAMVLAAIGIGLLLVLAVGLLLVLAKYNSRGFQSALEERIAGNVGAEVAIKGLSVTPLKARAKSLSLTWAGRYLDSLILKDLSTEVGIGGLVGADWGGEELVARSGRLQVGLTAPVSERGEALRRESAKPFLFRNYQCSLMTVEFGDRRKGGVLLKNSEMTLRDSEGGGVQLLLRGGILDMAGWVPLKLDNGLALLANGAMEIVSLRAMPKEGDGEALFKSLEPVQPGRPLVLALELKEFPLEVLAGAGMDAVLGGVVNSTGGTIHMEDPASGTADLRIEFSGTEAYLAGFPFLENMRTLFGDTDYVRPSFESVRGICRRDADGIELQNLEMEQADQMKLRGSIAVAKGGILSGRLELGIPESKAITATGRKRYGMFSDPKSGFCWVSIDLDGTVKTPPTISRFCWIVPPRTPIVAELREIPEGAVLMNSPGNSALLVIGFVSCLRTGGFCR